METLLELLDYGDGPEDTVRNIAQFFPDFAENEEFINSPESLISAVLQHPDLRYPDSEDTCEFFTKLFNRGPQHIQAFHIFIPIDTMEVEHIEKLKEIMKENHLEPESSFYERLIRIKGEVNKERQRCDQAVNIAREYSARLKNATDTIDKLSTALEKLQAS